MLTRPCRAKYYLRRRLRQSEMRAGAIIIGLSWVQVAAILGISDRHMRRLRCKVERWGMSAVSTAPQLSMQGVGSPANYVDSSSSLCRAGQTTADAYDSNGNELKITHGLSRVTQNSLDALNRKIKVIDPAKGLTPNRLRPGGWAHYSCA
jgi:hypothetical protein